MHSFKHDGVVIETEVKQIMWTLHIQRYYVNTETVPLDAHGTPFLMSYKLK